MEVFRAQNALNSGKSIKTASESVSPHFSKSFSEVYLDGWRFQVTDILVFIMLISTAKISSL